MGSRYCITTVTNDKYVNGTSTMIYSFLEHNTWFDEDIVLTVI